MEGRILTLLKAHQDVITQLQQNSSVLQTLAQMAKACVQCFSQGGRLFVMGNGGSAADAEHLVAELVGRFMKKGRSALPAFALTQNSATLTAIANDFGYGATFARQVEGLLNHRDILLAISTSGNSPNVLSAAQVARQKEITIFGLTGQEGGALVSYCALCLKIPSSDTQRIQEGHGLCIHILCDLIESAL